MPIQKTEAPAVVEDLFCFREFPYSDERALQVRGIFEASLGQPLGAQSHAPWPAIEGATIAVGRVRTGAIFILETQTNLLAVGAVCDRHAGEWDRVESGQPFGGVYVLETEMTPAPAGTVDTAWQTLTEYVAVMREKTVGIMQAHAVDTTDLMPAEPTQPASSQWIMVVPMIGLRYYRPDEEAILTELGDFGHYLLSAGRVIHANPVTQP